ncbi:MAG: FHA domain-containing protein, partial [Gemmatimonadaceae bacterium]|nr:FHA domain-containing protein [Gemmatimonadaceae bacterium]
KTLPEEQRDYFFSGPDPVTWIHIPGTVHQFELPKDAQTITVGSARDCTIRVPSEYMSKHHCTLERMFDGIRVLDHSKNGTGKDARKVAVPTDLRAGQTFSAGGGITFLALNDEMRRVYPLLCDLLGWQTETSLVPPTRRDPSADHIIQLAAGVDHLLINGDEGCDQEQLARAIHSISPLRARELVLVRSIPDDRAQQKELLVRATRTTMVLVLDDQTPVIDEAFRSAMFSTSYRIRLLVIGSPRQALAVLGDEHWFRQINLRPLAYRGDQLETLLDRLLEERGSSLRFAELSAANRKALLGYGWSKNFDELRLAADRLGAIQRTGSLRKAAAALGDDRWKVQYWFSTQVGLKLPLKG